MNTFLRQKGHRLTQSFWKNAIITPSILLLSLPSYSGEISVAPQQHSPIPVHVTPMLVSLGFDDNLDEDGLSWVLQLLKKNKNPDGADSFANASLKASFFMHCGPARGNEEILQKWRQANAEGHDIGNHTETHPDDKVNWNPLDSWMTADQWQQEIALCNELLMMPEAQGGVGIANVNGYRAPFLTYNDNTFAALSANNIQYDVSLPAGNTPEHDGTNNFWPHTLHNGSPEHDIGVNGGWKPPLSTYPNLWEIPLHTLIVPPDSEMDRYGLAYSLRDKISSRVPWFDAVSGKGDNFDWNLYFEPAWGAAGLNEHDVLAIYKYNLDLRLSGNKSPLVLGLHSGFYGYQNGAEHFGMPESTVESRRRVLEEFTAYALSKPAVRFVSHKQLVDWMEEPEPLTLCATSEWDAHKAYQKGDGVTYMGKQYQAAWWTMQQIPGLYENSPWSLLDACSPK